jgi:hypothetical protein
VRVTLVAACLAGLAACQGTPGEGGLGALEHYVVDTEIRDEPDLNTRDPQRQLWFQFFGDHVTSPERCASLRGATVRFAGMPLQSAPGGWVKNRVPTNNAPGETINLDFCEGPSIRIIFDEPRGEPQNGTLEIEGEGRRLTVPVNHPVGDPKLAVMSTSPDRIVLQVQGFPTRPDLAALSIRFSPNFATSTRRPPLQKRWLTEDGLLELLIPPELAGPAGGLDGSLLVTVDLGGESVACAGFRTCGVRALVVRSFNIYAPGP